MKKALLSIAVVYGACALAAPYFVGGQIAQHSQDFFTSPQQKRLADNGVELTLKQFDKGYFSSTADVALNVVSESGELLYQNDFRAKIAHAPLSLSGFNAATIHAVEMGKAEGRVGSHFPQSFIRATGSKSLASLMSGSRSVDMEINTTAIKTEVDGDHIDFDGLQAQFTTPTSDNDIPTFDVQFKQFRGTSMAPQTNIVIAPFTLQGVKSDDKTLSIIAKNMNYDAHNLQSDERFSLSFDEFTTNISALSAQEIQAPYIANVASSARNVHYAATESRGSSSITLSRAQFLAGFIEQDDAYALQFTLKADPELTGRVVANAPFNPTNIDINLNIAPFDHQFLQARLGEVFAKTTERPRRALGVLAQQIMGLMIENVMKQDVRTTVNATIDTASGKLVAAKGEVHEHFSKQTDAMNLMFDAQNAVPKYFYGSQIDVFLGKPIIDEYLNYLSRTKGLTGRAALPSRFGAWLDNDGNANLTLAVDERQALLNGEPAPF